MENGTGEGDENGQSDNQRIGDGVTFIRAGALLLERIARFQSTWKNCAEDFCAPAAASGINSEASEYPKTLDVF